MAVSTVTSETILLIASIIVVSSLSAIVLASVYRVGDITREKVQALKTESLTVVKFIFASRFDSNTLVAWVKNVGIEKIHFDLATKNADLFLLKDLAAVDGIIRVPYREDCDGVSRPTADEPLCWRAFLRSGNSNNFWNPGGTLEIEIRRYLAFDPGDYLIRYAAYAGKHTDISLTI